MRRLLLLVVLVLSLVIAPQSVFAKEQCFVDKAAYCFVHPFAPYWGNSGGLAVFGYPTTVAANEVNADTSQTYLTQWAERNRLEYHPENKGTAYEILLGLLGKDRLRQLNRDPAAEGRETGPKAGCLWFAETGHNVCNQQGILGFGRYWETNGLLIPGLDAFARSLQLFGLPLTEPKMETNSSGDTVLTQWFERARFEWHPNNPDQFKVLLGLLGKEVHGDAPPVILPAPGAACGDIPEPQSARISPKKCFKVGERITVEVFGFAANESITMWDISELEGLTVVPNVAKADTAGVWRREFDATRDVGLGFWQWSFKGDSSQHQANIYFRLDDTTGPPPPPPPPPPVQANCAQAAGPGAPESPVKIVGLNKSAETVNIRNVSNTAVSLNGWWICSLTGNQMHAVLSGTLNAGQTITVQSQAGGNIWNNSNDDDGALFDSSGRLISFWND